jgi:hypothetical protein
MKLQQRKRKLVFRILKKPLFVAFLVSALLQSLIINCWTDSAKAYFNIYNSKSSYSPGEIKARKFVLTKDPAAFNFSIVPCKSRIFCCRPSTFPSSSFKAAFSAFKVFISSCSFLLDSNCRLI